jgi:hypothetical protein
MDISINYSFFFYVYLLLLDETVNIVHPLNVASMLVLVMLLSVANAMNKKYIASLLSFDQLESGSIKTKF